MATADVQGKDQTKLANGGGAFPFWLSVVIVAGVVVAVSALVFAIAYGIYHIL